MATSSPTGQDDWDPYVRYVRNSGATAARDCLAAGQSMERVERLVRRVHRALDAAIAAAMRLSPQDIKSECRPGCSRCCCSLRVGVSPPEALVLADRLIGSPDERDRKRIERLTQVAREVKCFDLAGWSRRKTACPLLEANLCSLYSIRPLSCRGLATTDAKKCAGFTGDSTELVSHLLPHLLGGRAMLAGLEEGLRDVGLCGGPVEMISAVSLALTDETAGARWLKGENVFGHLTELLSS
jgi:Fe-S-cluster containining protein